MATPIENTEDAETTQTSNPQPRTRWIEVALIFVAFYVAGGAPAPQINETYYLTKAKHYWQPDWCAGDPFLESADAHLTFYWSVGWLAKWFDLPTVAWIGRCAVWLLLAISWQRLSSRIIPRPLFSLLTAILFVSLVRKTNFAGEWVIGGVEGKCFAYAFVFWGLTALIENRWKAAWLWFGLASAFHVLVGGWATIAAALTWLCTAKDDRPSLSSMLPALLVGGLLALPGVVPGLRLSQGVPQETLNQANQIYVFERIPHHLAPLTLPGPELLHKARRYLALVLAFLVLWTLSKHAEANAEDPGHERRILKPLVLFTCWTLGLSLFGIAVELVFKHDPSRAAGLLKFYWFRLGDVTVPLAFSLLLAWLISNLARRRSQWAICLALIAMVPPVWHFGTTCQQRLTQPAPPGESKLPDHLAWRDACYWIREHTPTDAMFLVPRRSQSFNWQAHRKDLVTWKDVPQDAESLITWREHYHDVFLYEGEDGELHPYGSLGIQGKERILLLAEKYDIDYVVAKEYPPLLLPLVYKNNSYAVYKIP